MHTPIVIICQNQISARGMREAMLNVLFHLLSQQQTRISCNRYMIVVKETEMKCKMSKITTITKYRLPIKNEIIPLL